MRGFAENPSIDVAFGSRALLSAIDVGPWISAMPRLSDRRSVAMQYVAKGIKPAVSARSKCSITASLFDKLVGDVEQRLGNDKPKRLS